MKKNLKIVNVDVGVALIVGGSIAFILLLLIPIAKKLTFWYPLYLSL